MRRRPADAAAVERIGRLYDRFAGGLYRYALMILAHGQSLPSRLEDLAPAYLDVIPIDPFSGKPLRFAAEEHGYVVYSAGLNRRDDGGRLATKDMVRQRFVDSAPPAADLGIRIAHR